ncbi:carotenoid biosynthesis protein [Rhodocytophaga rosea]|uniref:Carotenoid biosynthesis protein n=1 Tax=Rhodocytophaga rosea TaxID=2704465 RepID=A0A6C0GHF3_9BACT|nr:carotenoid biosynthesis protein [Rhodocytophaga rosea]QHT67466.1 carotenoid biosynthesis protein [Rhodocytophaga rosea]
MERKTYFYKIALALLIAMHIAGIIGLQHPLSRPLFQQLIAFNLLVTAAIVFYFHTDFNRNFIVFSIITFLAGFFIEVIGVATGHVFGVYTYGATLGLKWLNVPLLIGLNWLVLIYCTNIITNKLPFPWWVKALLGACLMVGLDFFIEPMAIQYDMWAWQDNKVPFQNYIGWFIASLVLSALFHIFSFSKKNTIAMLVYAIQLLFFMALALFF